MTSFSQTHISLGFPVVHAGFVDFLETDGESGWQI